MRYEKANRKGRALSGSVEVYGLQARPFVFVSKWQGQLSPKVSKMLPEQGPIEAVTTCLHQEGDTPRWKDTHTHTQAHAGASCGPVQLVAPVTLYPPLPNPSHGTSSQCGTIGLRSRLQRSIRGRRLRLMHPSVLPSPTSTLGCNTTWVNLHQPPSPPSSLELLCRNVFRPGTSVDGWAEVRHGPRNSHDRASKVLTD